MRTHAPAAQIHLAREKLLEAQISVTRLAGSPDAAKLAGTVTDLEAARQECVWLVARINGNVLSTDFAAAARALSDIRVDFMARFGMGGGAWPFGWGFRCTLASPYHGDKKNTHPTGRLLPF